MQHLTIRKVFALMVAIPLFLGMTWFFGIYMQPQGTDGAGFAAILILSSAAISIYVYGWLARTGARVRFRNRGVDGVDRDWGMGLMGASQHQANKRRRDDTDGDDFSGRRSSDEMNADGDVDEGGIS